MLGPARKTLKAIRLVSQILASPSQRRHFGRWLKSFRKDHMLQEGVPWITYDAIDYLQARVKPGMRVFEYGSGASTIFWARNGASIVSVEHDPGWHAVLVEKLKGYTLVDYRHVGPEPFAPGVVRGDAAKPELYLSREDAYKQVTFRNYASQIDEFADESFEVVVVDGRARPSCIRHGARKVKPGGVLVVDNADREYYFTHTGADLEGFRRRPLFGIGPRGRWMWETSIFEKPAR